jgi:hypothetical protein
LPIDHVIVELRNSPEWLYSILFSEDHRLGSRSRLSRFFVVGRGKRRDYLEAELFEYQRGVAGCAGRRARRRRCSARGTRRNPIWPPDMYSVLAVELMIWSIARMAKLKVSEFDDRL